VTERLTRRAWLKYTALAGAGLLAAGCPKPPPPEDPLTRATFDFIGRCARDDGSYAASPDPDYAGNSDTSSSDLAAVTYAAVLAKTVGRTLPHSERSIEFVQRHQQADGSFANQAGSMDAKSDLALLYNTTQGVVCLRALGSSPAADPAPTMTRFFENEAFKKLPWYTTSFFPLFYAALGQPFPPEYRRALTEHLVQNQKEDGYLGDHVAAAFHMAHYFRLLGEPVPRSAEMVQRVLHDQQPDGGWHLKPPNWDVHACYDASFILRQLGGDSEPCRAALDRAAEWALSCRNDDGGFGHYPGWHSDMDAVYFQVGTLVQAGKVPGVRFDLADAHTLGWGLAMTPGKIY
jgi:geranylgeranyl transferase type-2 subunit beta